MTMPVKIWAWEIDNDDLPPNGYYSVAEVDDSTPYIRADIAEELARALELAYRYGWMPAGDALDKYKEATK